MEAESHESNAFVTLTYERERWDALCAGDLRDWLKRYRKRVSPRRVRYYAAFEYGDLLGRPHFHVALFGAPTCQLSGIKVRGVCQCATCLDVRETWKHGFVSVGILTPASAMYIAKYVIKKMTRRDDSRLYGRTPEFARMSLRPGIGAIALNTVASEMMRYRQIEVPTQLHRGGGARYPLGRYIRRKVAEIVSDDPQRVRALLECKRAKEAGREKLQMVRAIAFNDEKKVQDVWREVQ